MQTNSFRLVLILALMTSALAGCDGDPSGIDSGTADTGPMDAPDTGPGMLDSGPAAAMPLGRDNAPTVGTQIDRAGRPAITAAAVGTFGGDATARDALKDSYNANDDSTTWASTYMAGMADMIAIFDGVDLTCGNQLGAGPSDSADRYDALAGVLADDRLLVNSASGSCGVYLGVEAQALLPAIADGGCGGRTPNDDVIATSYSVLVGGDFGNSDASVVLAALGAYDDTITEDDATHSVTEFPFLAAP